MLPLESLQEKKGFEVWSMFTIFTNKFCHKNIVHSFILNKTGKTLKVPLQSLSGPVGVTISLRMKSRGQNNTYSKLSKGFSKISK